MAIGDQDGLENGNELGWGSSPVDEDSDNDNVPDGWEAAYGLDPADGGDGALDSDGDNYSNEDEYYWGTDPNSSTSQVNFSTLWTGDYVFQWNSATGRTYHLYYSENLMGDTNWYPHPSFTNIVGTGGLLTCTGHVGGVEFRTFRMSVDMVTE